MASSSLGGGRGLLRRRGARRARGPGRRAAQEQARRRAAERGSDAWSPPRCSGCGRSHPSTARRAAQAPPQASQPSVSAWPSRGGTPRRSSPRSRGRRAARSRRRWRPVPCPARAGPGASANWTWRITGAKRARPSHGIVAHHRRVVDVVLQPRVGARRRLRQQRGAVGGAGHDEARHVHGVDGLEEQREAGAARTRGRRSRRLARSVARSERRVRARRGLARDAVDALVAEHRGVGDRPLHALAELRLPPGQAGDAEVAGGRVAHGEVEVDHLEAVGLEELRELARLVGVGLRELDGAEAGGRARRRSARVNGCSGNRKPRLAAKRGMVAATITDEAPRPR